MFCRRPQPAKAGLLGIALLIAGGMRAAPPLTTIQDVLYKADGSPFNGLVIIEWKTFQASDTSLIAANRVERQVNNGLLTVRLVPTTTAGYSAYYSVRYVSSGAVQFTEAWAVRPSSKPLRVVDVRIPDPILGPTSPGEAGGGGTPIEIDEVNGLRQELDTRVRQGVGFIPDRVAFINSNGELEGVNGSLDDCVRVDGTSGPCGALGGGSGAGGSGATFVDGETPSGAVNGSNAVFTLSQSPNPPGSLLLYRNGLLQKPAVDFGISASVVTFAAASIPQAGDTLLASYRTSGASGTLSQVICAAAGLTTNLSNPTSLGSCTIPGGLLRAGDRVELFFDYAHQGAASGFQYQVNWGATSTAARTAGAGVALATGRVSVGVGVPDSVWSGQNWGSALSLEAASGTAADLPANPITVDFVAWMSSPTTDTVTLRSLAVVRHPAP